MRFPAKISSTIVLGLSLPGIALAQSSIFKTAGDSLRKISTNAGLNSSQTPATLVGSIVNTALGILGLIAMGLILYAGWLWVTAAGNEDKVSQAKDIIKTTVVGIIIVGLAYAITAFIISLVAAV